LRFDYSWPVPRLILYLFFYLVILFNLDLVVTGRQRGNGWERTVLHTMAFGLLLIGFTWCWALKHGLGWDGRLDTWHGLHRILLCFWALAGVMGWDRTHYHDTTGLGRALQVCLRLPFACTTSHKSPAAPSKQNENTSEHRSATNLKSHALVPSPCVSGEGSPIVQLNNVSVTTQMPHTLYTHSVRNQRTARF
jgi:hypothetical protein